MQLPEPFGGIILPGGFILIGIGILVIIGGIVGIRGALRRSRASILLGGTIMISPLIILLIYLNFPLGIDEWNPSSSSLTSASASGDFPIGPTPPETTSGSFVDRSQKNHLSS